MFFYTDIRQQSAGMSFQKKRGRGDIAYTSTICIAQDTSILSIIIFFNKILFFHIG